MCATTCSLAPRAFLSLQGMRGRSGGLRGSIWLTGLAWLGIGDDDGDGKESETAGTCADRRRMPAPLIIELQASKSAAEMLLVLSPSKWRQCSMVVPRVEFCCCCC